MNVQQLPRLTKAIALVGAPVCFLASGLAVTALTTSDTRQVALIAADPRPLVSLHTLHARRLDAPACRRSLGAVLDAPDRSAALGRIVRRRVLRCWECSIAIGRLCDCQLVYWQMGPRGADAGTGRRWPRSCIRLRECAGDRPCIFAVGGLALIVGTVLLGVGLLAPACVADGGRPRRCHRRGREQRRASRSSQPAGARSEAPSMLARRLRARSRSGSCR